MKDFRHPRAKSLNFAARLPIKDSHGSPAEIF